MSGTRVFIGRLSQRIRESDIERFFKGYGKLRDVNLKNGYGFVEFDDSRDADDAVYELNNRELCGGRVTVEHAKGKPRAGGYGGDRGGDRGYGGRGGGYERGADRYEDRGGYRDDRGGSGRGRINYYESRAISKYGPPTRTKYRVIVENLSTRVSWQDLKDYLREAGEVTYADAHKHRKNEGVVDFATYEDMKRAIEKMDNTEINGRKIRLIEDGATKSPSRSRSRSRSRSPRRRSRSDSRSRSRSRSVRRSRSRSRSRSDHGDENGRNGDSQRSRSRSRSRTPAEANGRSRSRSRTPE